MNGKHLERITVGQGDNPLWHAVRKGWIMASVFYQVHTKVEKVDPELWMISKQLIEPYTSGSRVKNGVQGNNCYGKNYVTVAY